MGRKTSLLAQISLAVFLLLVVFFVAPFNILTLPLRIRLEPKPEKLANQGVPIAQAIVDYQSERGLFPQKTSDLIPKYLSKKLSEEWSIQFTGEDVYLTRRGGQPHSSIMYWFTGREAGQWRFYRESNLGRQINVSRPVAKKSPLTGEALFNAQVAEYESRIQKHPHEIWYHEDKICFLGLSKRTELLMAECERATKEFPDWWLPQLSLALFSPTNPATFSKFESWVKSHGSHINYWLLARYHREKGDIPAALEALNQLTEQPFIREQVMARWLYGTGFLFDACKYAYENRDYPLTLKLTKYWDTKGRPRSDQSWLPFEAAAELKLRKGEAALEHVRKILEIARNDSSPTANLEQLLQAAKAHDTNFDFQAIDPEEPWTLFRDPTP